MPRKRKTDDDTNVVKMKKGDDQAPRVITIQTATDDELQQLAEAKERIVALRLKRGSINDDIAKERKKLKASGWNLEGFDLACKLAEMDPAKRKAVDVTLHLAREALDIQVAEDLFAHADQQAARETAGDDPTDRGQPKTAGAGSAPLTH